ncbi:type-F conjugative transfer system protein TraW [Sphingomonadales bacterium EhC05]|nr:type-F conjugative transfer system protein TraW [Sphingomonadales bacterium EhC05]
MRYLPLLITVFLSSPSLARDYGQQGTHFPIIEQDLLEQIQSRLQAMDKNGDIDRLNQKLKARTIARVNRPKSVAGLTRANETTTRLFDPAITLQADILDHDGRRIWSKGTKVNPLDTVPLRAALIFLDGDDPAQLEWAFAQKPKTAKLILTNGAPLKLMKARQRRFYFDQGGKLTAHFDIKALPAMVDQQGRMLRIREFALPKQRGRTQ